MAFLKAQWYTTADLLQIKHNVNIFAHAGYQISSYPHPPPAAGGSQSAARTRYNLKEKENLVFIQTQHFILTITIKSWANSTYKERVFLFTFDRLSWRPLGNIKLISKNKERFHWLLATKVDEGQGESGDYQTELSQGQPEEIQSSLMSHHSLPKSNIPRPIEAFIKKVKRNIQSLVYTKPWTEWKYFLLCQ